MKKNFRTIYQSTFLKSGFLSMIEQAVFSITSFLTGIILARATSSVFVGYYALLLSITMIVLGLQRAIVATPLNVYYPKLKSENDKREYSSAIISIEIIFLFLLLIAIVVGKILNIINLEINIFCIGIFIVGYLFKDFIRQYFFASKLVPICFKMSVIQSFIQLVCLLILWKLEYLNLNLMILVIGVSNFISGLLFSINFVRVSIKWKEVSNVWNINKWTAKWSIGISLSDSVKNQISLWILNFFVSTSAVGIYTNNNSFAMLPQPIFNGLSQFLLPHFSELFSKGDYRQIRYKSIISFITILFCNTSWMFLLILFGKKIINVLYGQEYVVTNFILIMCCLRGFLTSICNVTSTILQATENSKSILSSLIYGVISIIVCGTILTWKYKIIGMCISICLMYFITAMMQFIQIVKIMKHNLLNDGGKCEEK